MDWGAENAATSSHTERLTVFRREITDKHLTLCSLCLLLLSLTVHCQTAR